MARVHDVVVLVGSLRRGSFNRRAAQALIKLAPANLKLEIVEIRDLPLYDQDCDDEKRPQEAWVRFRDRIRPADAVLFITPEYNRSVPGPLKNAIDVGSRPYGQSVWAGKPAAVMSVSPGAIGGFGANQHLRQSLVFLDMPPLQQAGGLYRPGREAVRPRRRPRRREHREVLRRLHRGLRRLDREDGGVGADGFSKVLTVRLGAE